VLSFRQIKDRFGKQAEALQLKDFESGRINDIFDSLQNKYRPFSSKAIGKLAKPVYQFANTAGYIVTLPVAAITALSEPVIMLSRLGPKASLWGVIDGIRVAARKTARTFMPQMKRSKLEESMASLMQTADLALNDSVRDIGDLAVSKKITDTFFRTNMLAQVTQLSRYMAFSAASRQIKDDIKILKLA
jgi:glycerol-3-phosphate O-acyltransferase